MITTHREAQPYRVRFENEQHAAIADTFDDYGNGGDTGFRPHELLEAALATCLNMTATMYAKHKGLPLLGVRTQVTLDRSGEAEAVLRYTVELDGELSDAQRERLLAVLRRCPVRKTLERGIAFDG